MRFRWDLASWGVAALILTGFGLVVGSAMAVFNRLCNPPRGVVVDKCHHPASVYEVHEQMVFTPPTWVVIIQQPDGREVIQRVRAREYQEVQIGDRWEP